MSTVLEIICLLLSIYRLILFVRIILSWFAPPISGIGRTLFDLIYDVTDPVLGLVRGLIPAVRMGTVGLDLSPIIVFVAISVIQAAIGCGFGL